MDILIFTFAVQKNKVFQVQFYLNMKHSIFALFALTLLTLASCQNTPSGSASGTIPENISNATPAADPKLLAEQILTDMLAARKEAKNYAPAHEQTFELIKSMKMSYASQGDAEKEHIKKLVDDAMLFYQSFQTYKTTADNLDSISTQLLSHRLNLEVAQQEYVVARKQLQEAGSSLKSDHEKMLAVKSEWERDFPGLGKK